MPLFSYKAIDDNGEIIQGVVEGQDATMAYDDIASSGLHILKIHKSIGLSDLYLKQARGWGIKTKDIVEFAANVSVMIKAGMPLITAISDIAESMDNRRFQTRLLEIKRSIELGSGFSGALAQHKDIFPDIFINLVAVGEETGRLEQSLSDIALHLQRMEDLKDAIIRALMYPSFALLGTTGALLFWLVYVLPKMSGLFTSMSVEIPALTQGLMTASDFSRSYWYLYILVPAAIYGITLAMSKIEKTRYYLDACKLKLPIIKLILHNKLLAVFAEQLRILLAAGITIDRSFDIMINVIDNSVYKKVLAATREEIILGSKVSDAIKNQSELFPTLVFRMLSIGESTGNLPEQLNYLSEYYIARLDDLSQKMGKMIEPIIILVIGGLFMVMIMGLLAPIYDLISAVGS
jgi:general secretion pathway protein F/type IV pilus assembly protein PilC